MLLQDKVKIEQITREVLRDLKHEGCDEVNAEWVMLTLEDVVQPDRCEITIKCKDGRSDVVSFALNEAESEEWVRKEIARQLQHK